MGSDVFGEPFFNLSQITTVKSEQQKRETPGQLDKCSVLTEIGRERRIFKGAFNQGARVKMRTLNNEDLEAHPAKNRGNPTKIPFQALSHLWECQDVDTGKG